MKPKKAETFREAYRKIVLLERADLNEKDQAMQFQKIGDDLVASYDSLEEAIAALAKAENLPEHRAMSRAASAYPRLLRRYRDEGLEIAKAAAETRQVGEAEADFMSRVDAIEKRDGISRSHAMKRARAEYPRDFDAYQRA